MKIGEEGKVSTSFELSPLESSLQWKLQHFPLRFLSPLRPSLSFNGFLSSDGWIEATPKEAKGICHAILEEANVLHFGHKSPFMAKGSMQAHLDHNLLQIHAGVKAAKRQFVELSGSLPIDCTPYPFHFSLSRNRPLSAELTAEGKLQDIFDFVNLGIHRLSGFISCRLFLSQTLQQPALRGELGWEYGSYENDYTGSHLENVSASFEAQGNEIKMTHLTATDGKKGVAEAEGKIELSIENHFPYSLSFELDHLHTLDFESIDACFKTTVFHITGTTRHALAQGNLIITEGTIDIPEQLPFEAPTLPITYVNRPRYLSSTAFSSTPTFPFQIDLELTTEDTINLQGKGLKSQWQGNIHLTGTNMDVAANGGLKLVKGEYAFLGKSFKLTEGEITFHPKPTPSAYLKLTGELNLPSAQITAILQGSLQAPQLTLHSNPQMPTSSILAFILFNKDVSDISHPEAIQLASASSLYLVAQALIF